MLPALISPLSIAPMIDWTYTHFRVFMRILASQALLYTDMQTPGAIVHNPARALGFEVAESPLALQLGGSNPDELAQCAEKAQARGFAEVNLNLGCPSDRVQAGRFGACLMAEPKRVEACIRAMKEAVSIPVTAKTRIGIDNQDDYPFFADFAHCVLEAGCDKLIVHARKAWLHGLNPKQNRTIPPLHYDYVYRIKSQYPDKPVVINGNIQTSEEIKAHLEKVDGVMLGRLACQNPYAVALIHHTLYPHIPLISRQQAFEAYIPHVIASHQCGVPMSLLLKPVLQLAHGLPGARSWKEGLMQVQQTGNYELLEGMALFFQS